MKRIFAILIAVCAVLAAQAATYGLDDLKNVHLADKNRYVTNPDGVLSPLAEAEINRLLGELWQQTSAEVLCVAVDDIDPDADTDDFATELFRRWGIGKKDKNNGLLFLIVKDRRKAVLRTGNGVEALLPDGYLGTLMRREMTPRFKQGDYDGGTIATLGEIAATLSSPEAKEEVMSKYANDTREEADSFYLYLCFCGLLAVGSFIYVLYVAAKCGKEPRNDRYRHADKLFMPMVILTIIGLGIPVLSLAVVYFWRRDLRRGKHLCPDCGTRMKLVDEVHDNDYLTREQDIEERLGTVDYDVWLCPKCGETEIIPYVQKASAYTECPVCHARALHVISDRIVKQPTPYSAGLRVTTSRCASCGYEDNHTTTLPKTPEASGAAAAAILGGIAGAALGGRGGGFGGGFGGSMGGGTTSGGGASGSW